MKISTPVSDTRSTAANMRGMLSRERLTVMRLFGELRGLGYAGGYDAVRRYAARWRRQQDVATTAAFVPLSFAPGAAYQFDWRHAIVVIKGVTTIVKVAHLRLWRGYRAPPEQRLCPL